MLHIAYLAGLFDGEGHAILQWRKGKTGEIYVAKIGISNQCREVLEEVRQQFGGFICVNRKGSQKPVYQWVGSTQAVETFLVAVYPYLRIKRRQAELLLEFRREVALTSHPKGMSSGGRRIPIESRARRAAIREELRQLNGYCWNKKQEM